MAGGTRKASRTRQPITRHPLFPAIVALWFCALFGLGSLAIRVALIESAVVASGIDLIVPAAAPPLGVTARILMALMLGLFGALIGYALGSRLSHVRTDAPQRRRTTLSTEEPAPPRRADRFVPAASAPPRPLSAFDELDEDGQIPSDAQPAPSPRRRALALTEPLEPDYACITAPLPGGEMPPPADFANEDTDVLELAEALPEETFVADVDPFVPVSTPLPEAATPVPSEPACAPVEPEPDAAPAPRLFDHGGPSRRFGKPDDIASPASDLDELPIPRLRAADPFAAAADSDEDDRDLPPRNLGPRFGAPVAGNDTAIEPVAVESQLAETEPARASAPVASAKPAITGSAAERLRATPLEQLSQLELIERLALSMQQRRDAAEAAAAEAEAAAAAAASPPAPPPAKTVFPATPEAFPRFGFEPRNPLPIEELPATFAAPQPAPDFAPAAAQMPAALRPIGFDLEPADDEPADDLVPRFAIPRAQAPETPAIPAPFAPVSTEPDEAEDAAVESEEFSSLLDLGRAPLRQPLIRIEEPTDAEAPIEPVVVFPGHGSRPFAAPAPAEPEPAPAPLPPAEPGVRRFDAPAAQPAPAAAARQDPEETERALRAALATLQRMSGAA